jgi:hypothetical protein
MEYLVILLDSGKMNWWKKSKKRFDKADSKKSNMNEDLFMLLHILVIGNKN